MRIWYKLKNVFWNCRKIIKWIPVLWNSYDWDYHYLLEIMRFKMGEMYNRMDEDKSWISVEKPLKRLKTCILLLDRIMKDEYAQNELDAYWEKWGHYNWDEIKPGQSLILRQKNIHTEADKEQCTKEFKRWMTKARHLQEHDKDLFFKLFRKHFQTWWT